MSQNKERTTYLDSVGGLMLVYMIIYHCALNSGFSYPFIDYTVFLGFFMQWFFFKAGMFYRPMSLKMNIRKSFKRLLVPWMWFNLIGTVIYFGKEILLIRPFSAEVVRNYLRCTLLMGSTPGNLALWFLLSLFMVRIIFAVLKRYRYWWVAVAAIFAIPLLMHFWLPDVMPVRAFNNIPRYVSNVATGLGFYALGYALRSYSPTKSVLWALIVAYTVIMVVDPTYVFVFENILYKGTYLLMPVLALLGILIIDRLAQLYADRTNPLSIIGRDTMPWYCLHWFVIIVVSKFFVVGADGNLAMFVALVGANAVLLPVGTYVLHHTKLRVLLG